MSAKEKRCENCEFYDSSDTVDGRGQCRFNAPLPTMKSAMMSEKFFCEATLNWPHVRSTDWCGQYKKEKL